MLLRSSCCQYLSTVLLTLFISTTIVNTVKAHKYSLLDKLKNDVDLSQFVSLVERNQLAKATFNFASLTVFAPLNAAFQKIKEDKDDSLVSYHMLNSAQTLSGLPDKVSSESEGNPPLWVSRVKQNGREEIYINNAKVVQAKSNFEHLTEAGKKQVLHVLDGVLEPIKVTGQDVQIYNPNAYDFLNHSEQLDLKNHRVRSFRKRVNVNDKKRVFTEAGKFTFFIPVDEGFQNKRHISTYVFQPPPRPDKIDGIVIDGHIIKDAVLFTDPTEDNKEYETLAYTDKVKVTISFSSERDEKQVRKYVKSHTIVGDSLHPTGVVLAEIVKANIPVSNGVVHLIHRPLMVVDTTVTQFLEDREDGPLYRFYEVIRDVKGDFMDRLTRMQELTLFAPSNAAWKDKNVAAVLRDHRINEILHMHLCEEKLPMDKIISNIKNFNQVNTLAPRRKLYFNVIDIKGNKTLTVEGGGVNATVIQPDIAATNGIVHIIDRVLGVPFMTVGRKLATDPMLNKTYIMGKAGGFNEQLEETKKRYTYFVPRDYAWNKMEITYPTAHKKLFMHEFAYHAKQILERHLVVADKGYTMAELRNMTMHEAKQLPTVRDVVMLKVRETDKSYYVEWGGEWAHVFRPDVECTNGVIHVIDTVFLRDSDIQVTGGGSSEVAPLHFLLGFILCLMISRYL
ncbi:fasciclin 1 Fas1 domain-containing isoform X3 [Rhodnius prolixus]|uniref:fasciclin 1 Fas1 domain-containing isoform X3 n=1 Tax=Rhodnius prolixus TaxID=13249 RepID=UPI003D189986